MVICECSEIGGLYGTGLNFMGGVRSYDLQVGRIFFLQTVTFHVNSPLRLDSGAKTAPFFLSGRWSTKHEVKMWLHYEGINYSP